MPGFAGESVSDERVAAVTVSVVVAETAPDFAVMIEVPTVRPRTTPVESTDATDASDEDQTAEREISRDEPSE